MSSVHLSEVGLALSETEQALRLFCDRVSRIPGVVDCYRHPVGRLGEEGVTVVVENLASEMTHDVVHAQESEYDDVPDVYFNLEIKDARTIRDRNR